MAASSKLINQYSTALFLAARHNKKEDKVLKDLESAHAIFNEFCPQLMKINDPIYKDKVRLDFVDKLSKKCKFDRLTSNFLSVLSVKKRFDVLAGIIEKYHELHCSLNNMEKIEVTSVKALTEGEAKNIEKFFSKSFKKKVWIDNIIDPKILGGVIIKMGSVVFDNSLLDKISRIRLSIEKEMPVEQ